MQPLTIEQYAQRLAILLAFSLAPRGDVERIELRVFDDGTYAISRHSFEPFTGWEGAE